MHPFQSSMSELSRVKSCHFSNNPVNLILDSLLILSSQRLSNLLSIRKQAGLMQINITLERIRLVDEKGSSAILTCLCDALGSAHNLSEPDQ